MTILAITITDPSPAFDRKSSEVTWLVGVLQKLEQEIGRGRGTVTSGTIIGTSACRPPNTALARGRTTRAPPNRK